MGGGEWGQKLVFAIKSLVLDIEMIPSGAAGEEHKLALSAQLMRIVPGCSPKFPVASVCVCGGGVELIIPMALPCAVWPASYPA